MGFGVWGFGVGGWGLEVGVWGLGFGVWDLLFGVWGLGFRVQGSTTSSPPPVDSPAAAPWGVVGFRAHALVQTLPELVAHHTRGWVSQLEPSTLNPKSYNLKMRPRTHSNGVASSPCPDSEGANNFLTSEVTSPLQGAEKHILHFSPLKRGRDPGSPTMCLPLGYPGKERERDLY